MGGDTDTQAGQPPSEAGPAPCPAAASSRVVIADGDAARRAALLDSLTQKMPEGTAFLEAATVSQALEHARGSRMVIIGGALREASAGTLTQILARRCPGLHVVDLAARRRAGR
ncbi:MAG: hypothetical protein ABSB69_16525 [Solirubrobacteraceae bacterium]